MRLVPKPIPDDEILGCTVPVFILSSLEDAIEEIRKEREAFRQEREFYRANNELLAEMLYEVLGESKYRYWLDRMNLKNHRLAARQNLPLWFWRPEKDLEIKRMLLRRAKFLMHEKKFKLDDVWDLLKEFIDEHAGVTIDDELLKKIIKYANANPGDQDVSSAC